MKQPHVRDRATIEATGKITVRYGSGLKRYQERQCEFERLANARESYGAVLRFMPKKVRVAEVNDLLRELGLKPSDLG